jgi:Asp-tRNA(Asn)/Glu-tRNA(Gln) amidotransferase A subunit family amidase
MKSSLTNPADSETFTGLDGRSLRALLAEGKVTAEELTSACLARIAEREPEVRAWQFLDPDYALAQARARDTERQAGRSQGPLFGLPVGVKDIFDTADMPTENGTPLMAGRRPTADAGVVARLRAAGAVIMGKTVSTELALYTPGKTRNPHNLDHTPGGSSSGSAAAVADNMVPLAIGSQTNGSVIRPAAYCGVIGFKPSHGLISRAGVLTLSPALDHVGVFARTLEDTALLSEVLIGADPADEDTRVAARPDLLATLLGDWPLQPDFAFVRGPTWHEATPDLVASLDALIARLGERCMAVDLPEVFNEAHAAHRTVMSVDMAHNLDPLWQRGRDRLSERLREVLGFGRMAKAIDYLAARRTAGELRRSLEPLFERYDAIVTAAAPGEAPAGLEGTGSPNFCTIWTLLGLPAVTLPLLRGNHGLPIGVQLVGAFGDDARLLRTARWLERQMRDTHNV